MTVATRYLGLAAALLKVAAFVWRIVIFVPDLMPRPRPAGVIASLFQLLQITIGRHVTDVLAIFRPVEISAAR